MFSPADIGLSELERACTAPMSDARSRLTRFYQKYAPDKLGNVDKLLEAYKGKEDALIADLVKKYGPEPSAAPASPVVSSSSSAGDTRARLVRFYEKYASDKMSNIDKILAHYAGKEDKMFADLVSKYGPEPPTPTSAPAQPIPAAAASPAATDYRTRLLKFYEKYAPDKVCNVDKILTHYSGKEEKMMADLVAKYGPEPSHAVTEKSVGGTAGPLDYRSRLLRFYEKYAPDKTANVDKILTHYSGKEDQMFAELVGKYGPEPSLSGGQASGAQSHLERLTRFLQTYAPEKVPTAGAMLQKYTGKEEEMFKALVAKFGPEPTGSTAATASGVSAAAPATAPTSSSANATAYRAVVEGILQKHSPDKVASADVMLSKFAGRENELVEALCKKFNIPVPSLSQAPQPTASVVPSSRTTIKERLERFLKVYAPEKMATADAMLGKYQGKEEEMMAALVQRFGPEPQEEQLRQDPPPPPPPLISSCEALLQQWIGRNGVERFLQSSVCTTHCSSALQQELLCLLAVCCDRGAEAEAALASQASSESSDQRALVVFTKALLAETPASSLPSQLPQFLSSELCLATVGRAAALRELVAAEVTESQQLHNQYDEECKNLRAWEADDKKESHDRFVQRTTHQRHVIDKALHMIGSVEERLRSDLWRVQEVEIGGRWLWFQNRRREIALHQKPVALQQLEAKFDRWRELVSEQRHALGETIVERSPLPTASSSFVRRSGASATPKSMQYHDAANLTGARVSRRHHSSSGKLSFHDDDDEWHERQLRLADEAARDEELIKFSSTPRQQTRQQDSNPARHALAESSATPLRSCAESPSLSARHTVRSPLRRSTSPSVTRSLKWNQSVPRIDVSHHPSKVAVSSPSHSALPPKLRIPTTTPKPFRLGRESNV